MGERGWLDFYVYEESVYLVKSLGDPAGYSAEVEHVNFLGAFIENLRELLASGLVDEIKVKAKQGYEDLVLRILKGEETP